MRRELSRTAQPGGMQLRVAGPQLSHLLGDAGGRQGLWQERHTGKGAQLGASVSFRQPSWLRYCRAGHMESWLPRRRF